MRMSTDCTICTLYYIYIYLLHSLTKINKSPQRLFKLRGETKRRQEFSHFQWPTDQLLTSKKTSPPTVISYKPPRNIGLSGFDRTEIHCCFHPRGFEFPPRVRCAHSGKGHHPNHEAQSSTSTSIAWPLARHHRQMTSCQAMAPLFCWYQNTGSFLRWKIMKHQLPTLSNLGYIFFFKTYDLTVGC